MEITGTLISASMDFSTNKMHITFETEDVESVANCFEREKGKAVEIVTKKKSQKRTLSANAYFHVLVGKIADKMNLPKGRVKNMLLNYYGQKLTTDDGELITLSVQQEDIVFWLNNESIHVYDGEYHEDGTVTLYVLKPSHELNREEFSILLDGTICDAKDLGIETLTPDEVARMISIMGE